MTCACRSSLEAPCGWRVPDQADLASVEAVEFRAAQVGVVVERPALAHDDEIAIAIDARIDEEGNEMDRGLARPAGHEHDRVRLGRLRSGRNDRDRQANRPAVRARVILGHYEEPTP